MKQELDYTTYEGQDYLVNQVKAGNAEASNLLYEQFKNLISYHANLVYKSNGYKFGISFDDIFQEGVLGYLEAIKRYDSSYKVKFITVANNWIKKYCNEIITTETGVGYRQRKRKYQLNQLREQGCSDSDIKAELGVSDTEFKNLINLPSRISLDMPCEDKDGNTTSISEITDFSNESSFEDEITRAESMEALKEFIEAELTDLEKDCLLYLYGCFGSEEKTVEDVMAQYNITSIKVHNTKMMAMRKIRMFMAKNHYTYLDFVG